MIRNPQPGDRVLAPGFPAKLPGVIVEVRRPVGKRKGGGIRCLVNIDGAAPNAAGEPIPRIFGAVDLEPEQPSARQLARGQR